ncbi:hypothetical protein QFC20_006215 [Naganishia adeliensis]|uniref:Uncharacterized protein n=1 Tax=Naganishia adeliensis TaxID=92952 RepID=A0ACC2VFQ3_9TREE|nr:hypothetical protein QFC20_006215 [Naganishia adeliensis]
MAHRITTTVARATRSAPQVRGISSSRVVRGGHAAPESAGESATTNESFMTPTWRNTAIATALALIIYNTFPSPPKHATSPSTDPEYTTRTAQTLPWFSRVLAQITPKAKTWTERNEKHLKMAMEAADDRLLFQEAERPRIHRLRNPGIFESASPNCVIVGDTIDLSDLVVKGDQRLPAQVGSQK